MNLSTASIAQILEWQAQLVAELARRAEPPAPPPQPRAPWETPAPMSPTADPDVQGLIAQAVKAALAAQQPRSFTNVGQPPAMLGGQSTRAVVTTTQKTDPVLAAKFGAMPPRPDIVDPETGRVWASPGVQGNGKGEGGAVEFGMPAGPEG